MSEPIFGEHWQRLLMELLRTDTQSPLETGRPPQVAEALTLITRKALREGFEVAYFEPPAEWTLAPDYVPLTVTEAAAAMGQAFTRSQPSLVLRAGRPQPLSRTLMLNFHVDTVAGIWPPTFERGRFVARGAVDAKGPGVAALAGVARAMREAPGVLDRTQIFIQCVAGEEGGAMGTYGTKLLIDRGFVGRLNVFAEPSGGVYFDSATSTMTARVEVRGEDSTDDAPARGDNASLILASVCRGMARELAGFFEADGRRMCVGGLHTGATHNRVFGSGELYLNFAYADAGTAAEIGAAVEKAFERALAELEGEFAAEPLFSRTASNARRITRLRWLKRGLPTLRNRDAPMERLLAGVGLVRCPLERADAAFTCDAIWAQGAGRYVIVYGPGDLAANRAHADGEFVALAELESYADSIASLVRAFASEASARR